MRIMYFSVIWDITDAYATYALSSSGSLFVIMNELFRVRLH